MGISRKEQEDYRLTTAEIYYHSVDSPLALQSLVWQDYDLAPDYPELRKFLTYWARHIDGVVQSVHVTPEAGPKCAREKYRVHSSLVH